MDKRKLTEIIDNCLQPIGFKRHRNRWVLDRNAITKIVDFQRSQYGERYYVNYGYIIKSLPLNNLKMHVFSGLGSIDEAENKRINLLLDLENDINDESREVELGRVLQKTLVKRINEIDKEEDLKNELQQRPHLNDVPLIVKNHFGLC